MGTDWREQISSIIADTNRNLGGRGLPLTHVPPLSFRSTRPVGLDTAFGEAMASSGTSAGAVGVGSSYGFGSPSKADASLGATSSSSAAAAPAPSGGDKPATALDNLLIAGLQSQAGNFQSSLQRILESVKFELDVRGSMAQKHMEAVREEMSSGMQEAERRCLDISRQVDTAVGVRLDTERQMREATERTVQRLQESIAEQHKESLRVVGDFQATALDHSEVLRRLEQELLSFKLETETKMTEEGRRLSGLVVEQKRIGESVELATADNTIGRLKEVELALLKGEKSRGERGGERGEGERRERRERRGREARDGAPGRPHPNSMDGIARTLRPPALLPTP